MRLKIKVPATSANLGAGFDCFGIALSLHNIFEITDILPAGEYRAKIEDEGAEDIITAEQNNFFIKAYKIAMKKFDIEPYGLEIKMRNAIPMRRGLGSSSSAIVAGVAAANILSKKNLDKENLLEMMTEIEGHPDNVVPCCLGGMVVSSWTENKLRFLKMPPMAKNLRAVIVVPEQELPTEESRNALPKNVPMRDAVFNIGRAALFAANWALGNFDDLRMEDRLHQPYRAKLIKGGRATLGSGAALSGVAISGAGSSVIAFAHEDEARNVGENLHKIFADARQNSKILILEEDREGLVIERISAVASTTSL